jgi:hypothetical protein
MYLVVLGGPVVFVGNGKSKCSVSRASFENFNESWPESSFEIEITFYELRPRSTHHGSIYSPSAKTTALFERSHTTV